MPNEPDKPASTSDLLSRSDSDQPRRDFPETAESGPARVGQAARSGAEVLDRPAPEASSVQSTSSDAPLLSDRDAQSLRDRWEECQRSFVDEPRDSVKAADELVAELMQSLAGQFAETREGLESQWSRGDDVSTENLRLALQRYRDFFNRLLAV